ncbi:MAG: DNA methyltransferase [Solirubrobacteraceae bacterium]
MSVLSTDLRKELERACVRGRRAAEAASRAAIGTLGVLEDRPAAHLSDTDRDLRRALRAKHGQLGDRPGHVELLVAECAYEQWHKLLFARFLSENGLLIHPHFGVKVTLAECDELADDLGEPDAWAVAGRFAAEILPGIFRLDDPCVRLRLAPEGRLALETIVESISADTFVAADALGWVYQHWQKERKDEVNAAESKIGRAELAPVTQLFTENYMVRFLLENSLGAWWASRRPASALVRDWRYLRVDDQGEPAAGAFEGWPSHVADVTVLDPCCGSGHFLVEAFDMLWRMRSEEEDLSPIAAQDAVLRDNLFGLELDPRCVQIAMFAIAMAAWKAGGGWRELPVPNVYCSGISVKAPEEAWRQIAPDDLRIGNALGRLHSLFADAEILGSLIDPRRAAAPSADQASFDDADWSEIAPLIDSATADETADPAVAVLGAGVASLSRAADALSRGYTLTATNPPYLTDKKQSDGLRDHLARHFQAGSGDLATAFLLRLESLTAAGGSFAAVTPQNWQFQGAYEQFRRQLLGGSTWSTIARLGPGAFGTISGWVVNVSLSVFVKGAPTTDHGFVAVDVATAESSRKPHALCSEGLRLVSQADQLDNPDARILLTKRTAFPLLSDVAAGRQGIKTGDDGRFRRCFWELPAISTDWSRFQSSFPTSSAYSGRSHIVLWEHGRGTMARSNGARIVGREAWKKHGVIVSQMGNLPASLYTGELFDTNASPLIPEDPDDLPALWAFCSSAEYSPLVRAIDTALKVTNSTLVKVPFDAERWRRTAAEAGALPEPHSDDPTQWVFNGGPEGSHDPLQVAVARLLGYRWPDQTDDDLDHLSDDDGIVCLPSVLGERTAADRVQEVLARAFGGTWSPARASALLATSGSTKGELDSWLRHDFFNVHCQVFKNRPFVWHVWDGRNDGFSALVNYHLLDRPTLERLAYTYLGDWIERQSAGTRENTAGAEERLIAARELQRKLALILAGEPPYDIYIRWKSVAAQAIGWEPDLNDGVRLNIRPFVQAGVLRTKFNVKWERDRGKNQDGAERHNDLHLTNAEKQAARRAAQDA